MKKHVFWIASLCACSSNITSINPDKIDEAERRTRWTVVDAPAGDYFAVHGSAAGHVFIVGRRGKALRFYGEELVETATPTTENLFGVYVVSPTLAYAVGTRGTIIAWNGTEWSAQESGSTEELRGVWASDSEAWVVGGNATILYKATLEAAWTKVALDSPDDLFAVVKGSGQPFAVGTLGTIATYDGTAFRRTALAGYPKTLVAAVVGPGGTLVGGVDGAVFRRDRGNARIEGLQASFVRSIATPGASTFIVGWDGMLARVREGTTLHYRDAGTKWLYGTWASSETDVWVVGADSTIMRGPPIVDPSEDATL
jgi:photosystem II stability/assembly factor-like uncharacterized protein